MTTLERWGIAALVAATVVAAGAGGAGKSQGGNTQEGRDRIEQMSPAEKKQLLEKQQRFLKLSAEKQQQLRQLHNDLQTQENREELEQVMEAYYEWVCTLSASERSQLERLRSPEERIELVTKYRTSPGRRPWRRGGFGSLYNPFGGRSFGRSGPPGFLREFGEALRKWAGPYVAKHGDQLAALLPPEKREEWKAYLQKARSESSTGDNELWHALVPWFLAGPSEDLPITEADVAEFEKILPPDADKWRSETPPDMKIRDIQHGLRSTVHFLFASGREDLKDLVSAEQLREYHQSLPADRQDSLARLPAEMQSSQLRFSYFLSKLTPQMLGERDGRYPFGHGGPPPGDPRRDGPPDSRRGPRGDFRDFDDQPQPGGMRPERPGIEPPPPPRPGGRFEPARESGSR